MVTQHKCVFQAFACWNLLPLMSVVSVSTLLTSWRNINLITGVFHKELFCSSKGYWTVLRDFDIAESTAGTCIGAAGRRSLLLWVFYTVISRLKCCRQQRLEGEGKKVKAKKFIFEHLKLVGWEYFSRHCLGKVTSLGLGEMS